MVDIAYAQAAGAAAPAAGAPGASMFGAFFPFILIMVLFYFLMVLPQNKEKKKREAMLAAVKPGDRVLTQGGIWGTVANVSKEKDMVTLRIADNVKIEVARAFITSVEDPSVPETKLVK